MRDRQQGRGIDFFDGRPPRFFAHRGDSLSYPENTLPAFEAAAQKGIAYLEMDVWMSLDQEIVVHHDRYTSRTCGRDLDITQTGFARLRSLDPGWGFVDSRGQRPFAGKGLRIPALKEVLQAFPESLFNIEIKQAGVDILKRTIDLLYELDCRNRVLLASHADEIIQALRSRAPDIYTNFGYFEARDLIQPAQDGGDFSVYSPPGEALQIPPELQERELATPEVVQAAHSLGVEVHVWTVNHAQQAEELLRRGVDGIMSDDSSLLQRLAEKWGK